MMITKIDIANYGAYQNFKWDELVNKDFGSRNIIYGRNYSGKTTLSRIFRSIKRRAIHKDFEEGEFKAILGDGQEINANQIENSNLNIRVYNSDYKEENLSVLNDENGNITPFTILGEKNIQVEKEINITNDKKKKEESRLGDMNEKTGITWDLKTLQDDTNKKNRSLNSLLTSKASGINRNNTLFRSSEKKKQYNRTDLEREVKYAKPLSADEVEKSKNIINDEVKSLISIDDNSIKLDGSLNLIKEADKMLSKEVKPSKTIGYLLENQQLQHWVKEGVELHRDIRDTCAFCQNRLEKDLWTKIDEHFTKESEEYNKKIVALIEKVNNTLESWESNTLVNKTEFYSKYHNIYDDAFNKWIKIQEKHINNLTYIQERLEQKVKDIFSTVHLDFKKINSVIDELSVFKQTYYDMIQKNNDYTGNLDLEQNKARTLLRQDEINGFLKDISYHQQVEDIDNLKKEQKSLIDEKDKAEYKIYEYKERIKQLESEINDEEKAVRQVNIYLKSFLGHPELSLELEKEEDKKSVFVIKRNSKKAYNLSEGEKSLLSFCYFLSNLKDISNPEDYIIFVDDPISSLDNNNLFYIFSLLDSEIARKDYKQLIISTHNLDLLKYLQRIGTPTTNKKWRNKYFIVEKKRNLQNETNSQIIEMPAYLKKYATEFTYLFDQISIVALEEQDDSNTHSFYSFPNAARKFLESYLFFKYPDHNLSNDKRLAMFFDGNTESVAFLNRINNEFSHGENQFDRLEKPVNIPEFKKDAQLIFKTIANKDADQFRSLCNSIGLEELDFMEFLGNPVADQILV